MAAPQLENPNRQMSSRDQLRQQFQDMLRGRSTEVTALLPGTFGTDEERRSAVARFLRQLMMAIDRNSALLDCSPSSFWSSALAIAACGLDPSGNGGEAAIVPFKGVATPMVMARGYIVMAIRSGAAKAVDHGVVCEGDDFEYELGSSAHIRHRPALRNRGEPVAAWCIAVLPTGERVYEVMGWDEVMDIRARSRSADKGPWVTDPMEMGRKTVLRRIMKRLPWNSDDLMDRLVGIQRVEDDAFGLPELRQTAELAATKPGLAGLREVAERSKPQALESSSPQDVSNLAEEPQPQATPVPVASTPKSVAAPAMAGQTCPRCSAPVKPEHVADVLRLKSCPECAKR